MRDLNKENHAMIMNQKLDIVGMTVFPKVTFTLM